MQGEQYQRLNLLDKAKLRKFVPFAGLQDDYLDEAQAAITTEVVKKGGMLFKRGRKCDRKFYLLEGQVDLISSEFMISSIKSGSSEAKNPLNADTPTKQSGVVKSDKARVMSISSEALDRLVAWSESAEAAFEAELNAKQSAAFMPSDSQFVVTEVEEDDQSGDWMSSLLQSPLFTRVPLSHVQDLFTRFEDVSAEDGETIVREGQKGDYFYVLAAGKARITNKVDSVDIVLSPGQYFGEEALLGSTLRNATVKMLTPGRLKRLDHDAFFSLLKAPVLQYIEASKLSTLKGEYKVIDVKMPMEFRVHHVDGSINVPLPRLRKQFSELAKTCTYVVSDDAGSRSEIAAHLLCQAGFDAFILQNKPVVAESA